MDNEKETTTRKVTSNPITPVDEFNVSEQHTTRVTNDTSATGVIIGVLLALAVGIGAVLYYLNNRPNSPIIIPGATNTIKENKSTTIERENTTIKDAPPQTTPNVEVNIPTQPAPKVEVNVPPNPTAPNTPPSAPNNNGQ